MQRDRSGGAAGRRGRPPSLLSAPWAADTRASGVFRARPVL